MTLKDTIKYGIGIGIFAFAALSAFAIDVKIDTSKTCQTIDNFAAAIAPFLDDKKAKLLQKVVADLKKI